MLDHERRQWYDRQIEDEKQSSSSSSEIVGKPSKQFDMFGDESPEDEETHVKAAVER